MSIFLQKKENILGPNTKIRYRVDFAASEHKPLYWEYEDPLCFLIEYRGYGEFSVVPEGATKKYIGKFFKHIGKKSPEISLSIEEIFIHGGKLTVEADLKKTVQAQKNEIYLDGPE